jgi:UPF0042 nucleotide-binding protein
MSVTLVTFGFKYGRPNTNFTVDVSFLRNPAREDRWTLFSEADDEMRAFLLAQPAAEELIERIVALLELVAAFDDDVRLGVGCSGGRHRSRIVSAEIAGRLEARGISTRIVHREEVAA